MQKILKMLNVVMLTSITFFSSLSSLNSNIKNIGDDDEFNFGLYDFSENAEVQDSPGYSLYANLQNIIRFWNYKETPSQSTLAHDINSKLDTNLFNNALEVLNQYLINAKYSMRPIEKDFGKLESNRDFFQNAIVSSLTSGYPVFMITEGNLPWTVDNFATRYFTIYGMRTYDKLDPSATTYYVSDPGKESNLEQNLLADGLGDLFWQNSCIFTPSDDFDFDTKTISSSPEIIASTGFGTLKPNETLEVYETANILSDMGFLSIELLKRHLDLLSLPKFSIFYKWYDKTFFTKGSLKFSTGAFNSNGTKEEVPYFSRTWVYATEEINIKFSSSNIFLREQELRINMYIESIPKSDTLKPYVGIAMGHQWIISYD